MALLRRGCMCCQLRTCVLVQGWMAVVLSILQIAAGALVVALLVGVIPFDELPDILRAKIKKAYQTREGTASLRIEQALQAAFLFLSAAIELPIAITLIYGCKKENRHMVLPYLIWNALALVSFIAAAIIAIITTVPMVAAIIAVIAVPCLGLGVYFWLHILSYYLELRDEDKELIRESL